MNFFEQTEGVDRYHPGPSGNPGSNAPFETGHPGQIVGKGAVWDKLFEKGLSWTNRLKMYQLSEHEFCTSTNR